MSKFCGNCGAQLDDNAKVCGNCGIPTENQIKNLKKEGELTIFEIIKKSAHRVTVIFALAAVALSFVSLYLPWFTLDNMSQSVMQAVREDPDFFVGLLPAIVIALSWIAVFFVTNHPKLSLLGVLALLFLGVALIIAGVDRGLGIGFGGYLYMLLNLVFIGCSFATKKMKKDQQIIQNQNYQSFEQNQ